MINLDSINTQQCSSSNKAKDFYGISKLGENDVLLGRGTPINNHKGNITFRDIVKQHKDNYLCAKNNYEKYLIAMEVQQKIRSLSPPGHFLRRHSKTNIWIEIDDNETRQKIFQALREKLSSVMKCDTNGDANQNNQNLTTGNIHENIGVQNDETSANNDSNSLKAGDADEGNVKTSVPRKKSNLQKQSLFSQIGGHDYIQSLGEKAVLTDSVSHEKRLLDEQECKSSYYEDNKAGMSKDIVKSVVDFPLETVMDIKSEPKGVITSAAKTSVELHIASSTTSIPLEPGPSTEMPSTNNVDRMNKASLVARRKRSNSELSVDGLALLASTVIAEWDHTSQKNIVSREDRWLEKYNQLKEFYNKNGHAQVTHSNCVDKSLVYWVITQRRCGCTKNRIQLLNALGFVWFPPKLKKDQWLEKRNQLKEFYQKHGRVPITYSNCADKSLVRWAYNQRCYCKMESRIKLLNDIGFVCSHDEWQDQWLKSYNQLKEFYDKNGHTKLTCSNCADKSLVHWVMAQRRCCKMEKRRKMLNLIGFVFSSPRSPSESEENKWLQQFIQLKEFYNAHGHTRVVRSNSDMSLVKWAHRQRHHCNIENRRKMLESIEFIWHR